MTAGVMVHAVTEELAALLGTSASSGLVSWESASAAAFCFLEGCGLPSESLLRLETTVPSGCTSLIWNLCDVSVVLPNVAPQYMAAAWWLAIACLVTEGNLILSAAALARRSTVWLHHHSSSVSLMLPSCLRSLPTSVLDL